MNKLKNYLVSLVFIYSIIGCTRDINDKDIRKIFLYPVGLVEEDIFSIQYNFIAFGGGGYNFVAKVYLKNNVSIISIFKNKLKKTKDIDNLKYLLRNISKRDNIKWLKLKENSLRNYYIFIQKGRNSISHNYRHWYLINKNKQHYIYILGSGN